MSTASDEIVESNDQFLGAWRVFAHFDGSQRFNGDHDPIRGRCATNYWQPGDYIIDRFTGVAGTSAYPAGKLEIWTGFFTPTE